MKRPAEQPGGSEGSPRFGRLLLVLALAIAVIVVIVGVSEAWVSK